MCVLSLHTTTAAEEVFSQLQDSLSLLHLSVGDELLLATDFDLLLDAGVLIWELVRPAFSLVRSHDADSCQQFLSQPTGTQVHTVVAATFKLLIQWSNLHAFNSL